jgi:hypothetical protein
MKKSENVRPVEQRERIETIGSWKIRIQTYRVGEKWVCVVDNVDPGAVIYRTQGTSREVIEQKAIKKAEERLSETRIMEE